MPSGFITTNDLSFSYYFFLSILMRSSFSCFLRNVRRHPHHRQRRRFSERNNFPDVRLVFQYHREAVQPQACAVQDGNGAPGKASHMLELLFYPSRFESSFRNFSSTPLGLFRHASPPISQPSARHWHTVVMEFPECSFLHQILHEFWLRRGIWVIRICPNLSTCQVSLSNHYIALLDTCSKTESPSPSKSQQFGSLCLACSGLFAGSGPFVLYFLRLLPGYARKSVFLFFFCRDKVSHHQSAIFSFSSITSSRSTKLISNQLSELRLAVAAGIFVAETTRNLEVAFEPGHH